MSLQGGIITSLLDTDLYKYTMQQAMVLRYPDVQARMVFRCRSGRLNLSLQELRAEIDLLASLTLSPDELQWLSKLPFIKPEFIQWLSSFRLDPSNVVLNQCDGQLEIEVSGNWAEITHFEIYILAIVSELHCRNAMPDSIVLRGEALLKEKIGWLKQQVPANQEGFSLVDFGSRRRYSSVWQAHVVSVLKEELGDRFSGTSNLHLARTLGLKPVGTMAHEWLQAHQALSPSLADSQRKALKVWLDEYGRQLGVALTDTISMKAFLADFNDELASRYMGIRHDSGDPFEWGEQAIAHYRSLGIDPRSKTFVFSDKLDFDLAIKLFYHFCDRVNVSFGIGTYLTNDMGVPAPNIVLKLVEVDGRPVAKLSDNPEKVMCQDVHFVEQLKQVFA